jgi:hypothetical protein
LVLILAARGRKKFAVTPRAHVIGRVLLIAAEKCGRQARLVEFDPAYCDRIITRFETFTGKEARLAATEQSFEDVAAIRAAPPAQAAEELA